MNRASPRSSVRYQASVDVRLLLVAEAAHAEQLRLRTRLGIDLPDPAGALLVVRRLRRIDDERELLVREERLPRRDRGRTEIVQPRRDQLRLLDGDAVLRERQARDRAVPVGVAVAGRLLRHEALAGVTLEVARARLRELVLDEQPRLAVRSLEQRLAVGILRHRERQAALGRLLRRDARRRQIPVRKPAGML